jgi:retron-type reverse transcriptase
MSQHVGNGRVLKLVHRMLKAKLVMRDGTCVVSEEGTPQGGPLSPLLSNIVLDELDWELDRRDLKFVRYPLHKHWIPLRLQDNRLVKRRGVQDERKILHSAGQVSQGEEPMPASTESSSAAATAFLVEVNEMITIG